METYIKLIDDITNNPDMFNENDELSGEWHGFPSETPKRDVLRHLMRQAGIGEVVSSGTYMCEHSTCDAVQHEDGYGENLYYGYYIDDGFYCIRHITKHLTIIRNTKSEEKPFCCNCGCDDETMVFNNGSGETICDNCGHNE